jgi:hypothetical protein
MAQYMIVYKGDATDMSEMTQDEMQAVMAKWAEWMQGVGSALADVGTPFGPSSSIVDDRSAGTAVSLTGYSIVEADNMDGARALADSHPFLSEGKGDFAIDLYEMMPVPTMDG